MKAFLLPLTLVAVLVFGIPASNAADTAEAQLVAVLKSGASQKEKADACRELARVGSREAVPALAALLGDEQLSHMARYGLETIPDPAVDQALRDALGTLKGRQLAGAITSLGVRRDASSVKLGGKLLQDADPDVANAAARALGDIATKDAAQALEASLANATAANKLAICEGLFRCAEAFARKGVNQDAIRIYDRLRALPEAAHQVRAGALRGAILVRGKDGVPLLTEAICGNDWILADAAARTAMELPGTAVTEALTETLGRVSGDRRILILQAIGRRADAAALPAVLGVARSGDKPTRIMAIRTVAEIGDASAAGTLAGLTQDADREIARAARGSLAGLPGPKVDDVVLGMLTQSDSATRQAGLELIALRRMGSAVPALLKATADTDPRVRTAAVKLLGEFGGESELPALLALLESAPDAPMLTAVGDALSRLCARIAKPDLCADQLIARLAMVKPAQQAALLRVLGSVGGAQALATLRAKVGNAEKQVHTAAVNALAEWPTAEIAPELLTLNRSLNDADEKLLCLRSYLRWAGDADLPAKDRLAMCGDAAGLVQQTAEKKLLLAALGGIPSPEAASQIEPFLNDAEVREEACVAVVGIAEKLAGEQNAASLLPRLVPVLERIATTSSNAELVKRAKAVVETKR